MRALSVTDVARRPLPGTVVPVSPSFSPDGVTLRYLMAEDGSLTQHLVAVDVATGQVRVVPNPGAAIDEASLSLEEKLRRERSRQLAVGVTRFHTAIAAASVLVPMADGLWFFNDLDAEPRLVVADADVDGAILDPQLSSDGTLVGFVLDNEVHVAPTSGGPPVAVTAGAADGVTQGLAEFVAQEEMGREQGFWFSPDGSQVAFCRVDDRHIPRYRIMHLGADEVEGAHEDHAYPFAGAENATVQVGVVASDGSTAQRPVWLDLDCTGIGHDRYVARVDWSPDGEVWVQVEDRAQTRLDIIAFDPATGKGRPVHSERSDVWINLHDMLRFLPGEQFLWASERSGFRHLELRSARDGSLIRDLTGGGFVVTSVSGVGDDAVWFVAATESALERHLFRVGLDGQSGPQQVTTERGVHAVAVHPGTAAYLDTHSTPQRPAVTTLHTGTGSTVLADAADDVTAALALTPPEEWTVSAADGTRLNAAVFRPDGPGPHPLIVWVYGGPHAQLVTRSWSPTVAMRAQFLRQEGFCVAVCDGRGSTDRGLAFEGHLRHRMGTVEVDDQVALVASLVGNGVADPGRVGIYGWSYGGYLSAMCLARRPDVFSAACAGAPVTAWDGYDTHYTERYMSTPATNPDGYRDGSVMTHAAGIPNRGLLLIHGLIDENVHFRHTARLIGALNRAGIAYELLLYPDERHLPRAEADRVSMEQRIVDFFTDRLRDRRPQ